MYNGSNNVKRSNKKESNVDKNELMRYNLDVISKTADYIDTVLDAAKESKKLIKVSIADITSHLETIGYSKDQTKYVVQFIYIMMDLANAQINKFIRKDRVDIRITYLKERLETSFYLFEEEVNRIINSYKLFVSKED